ncbi:hypothetical protein GSI_07346 [Ganoderma sinense ZZ0214-1]|uniref:Uncharacterized protein n=1 Tax=Ganoderma sinense ZZ0214-1 TaxID=1077348 RepID=A0A2G8SA72_9APHY|nr:hypothetical protein GSI_07346 [Ganoderma sinense ZZ0214-1]
MREELSSFAWWKLVIQASMGSTGRQIDRTHQSFFVPFPLDVAEEAAGLGGFSEGVDGQVNTLALDVLQNLALDVGGTMVEISLSSLSFGALTILSFTSVYFLICRGSAAPTNAKILILGTVVLYVSTAIYMAAFIWAWSNAHRLVSRANQGLFSPTYDGRGDLAAFNHALRQQSWMMTVALGVNFVIGDATVWWRVCVIWQHKSVNCVGLLLIFVIVYQVETLTTQDAGPLPVFTTVAADFTYGCLVPIVAIYPAIIIVLVALKRSPIDNGELSRARQAVHGRSPETADVGASSTIVFRRSTFCGSASEEMEVPTNGVPATDCQSMHSLALETSTSEGETKDFTGFLA